MGGYRGHHVADSGRRGRDPPYRVGEDRHQARDFIASAAGEETDRRPGLHTVPRAKRRAGAAGDFGFQTGMADEGASQPFGLETGRPERKEGEQMVDPAGEFARPSGAPGPDGWRDIVDQRGVELAEMAPDAVRKGAYPDYLTSRSLTGVPGGVGAYPVRTEPFPRVMVGEGRPSTSFSGGAERQKSVDGRPSPTMTAGRDGCAPAGMGRRCGRRSAPRKPTAVK